MTNHGCGDTIAIWAEAGGLVKGTIFLWSFGAFCFSSCSLPMYAHTFSTMTNTTVDELVGRMGT